MSRFLLILGDRLEEGEMEFDAKVVIVPGATTGLGERIAAWLC
jgi:hypothetical protein